MLKTILAILLLSSPLFATQTADQFAKGVDGGTHNWARTTSMAISGSTDIVAAVGSYHSGTATTISAVCATTNSLATDCTSPTVSLTCESGNGTAAVLSIRVQLCRAHNVAANTLYLVAVWAATPDGGSFIVGMQVTNIDSTSADGTGASATSSLGSTAPSPGAITISGTDSILLGAFITSAGGSPLTITENTGGSWVSNSTLKSTSCGANICGGLEYKLDQSSGGTASWTIGSSGPWAAVSFAYVGTGAPPSSGSRLRSYVVNR